MNSYIYEFKDLPSTDTPYKAETFTAMQNKLLDSVYPIGSIIIKDDATDYSSYLGFTWEKVFAGVTLVGLDTEQTEFNEVGKIGGEKTHKLTTDEMPSHNHDLKWDFEGATGSGHGTLMKPGSDATNYVYQTGNKGGGQPHNNLQPYQVVVFWKRVA